MKYSNCLIEAVRAKFKDPDHIKIIVIKPHIISKTLHIAWTDGEYFYHAYNQNHKWWNRYLYKPTFKKVPFIVFEALVCDKLKGESAEFQKDVLKTLGIHLADIPYTDCSRWCWVCGEEDLPKQEDVRYMEKLFRGKVFIKVVTEKVGMKVLTYEEVLKLKIGKSLSDMWGWRYVTPMDTPDYYGLYGYHKRIRESEITDELNTPPISRKIDK